MKRRANTTSVDLQLESQSTGELNKRHNTIKRQKLTGNDPDLTVKNVVKTLQRVKIDKENCYEKWQWVGKHILHVSRFKLNRLTALCSNDETVCYQEIVRYWLENHSYASWRELINQLDRQNQQELADDIRGKAEILTDSTLTLSNVKEVLSRLKRATIKTCLLLPPSACNVIKRLAINNKDDEDDEQERLITYWLNFSPFANWVELSGKLYHKKETEALDLAKTYIKTTPERTLTLTNLYMVWKDLKSSNSSYKFPWRNLNIHCSVINEMESRHTNDPSQQSRALCEHFLDHYPAPSWERVAYALYLQAFYDNCYEPLEIIQRNYLKGTSETRRLFKESMVFGHILSSIVKVLLIGGPGVGKTSTKAIILCEDPPEVYISTPLAMRAVKVYRVNSSDPKKWVELSRKDRNRLLAKTFPSCSVGSIADLPKYKGLVADHQQMEERSSSQLEEVASPSPSTAPTPEEVSVDASTDESTETTSTDQVLMETSTADELITLQDNSTGKPVEQISRVQITDSGGQPQFQELLPIFVTDTSMYLFVQKLSEELSTHTMVEYLNKKEEHVCEPYHALQSNLQIFQRCLQVLRSQRTKNKESNIPHLMMIGTFKDKVEECEETPDDKEKIFQKLLFPKFEKKVRLQYSSLYPKRLIFQLNARNPGDKEKRIAEVIRQVISDPEKCSVLPIEIPLQWHALESLLEEISEKSGKDVLSRQECLSESKKLLFEEDSFKAALLFFHDLNVIYYYPKLLPEIVFTNTQVLLDMVTELVELIHIVRRNGETTAKVRPLDRNWQRFHDYALVSVDFLSKEHYSKHYVVGLFTASELVQLFSGLSVFAKFNDDEYFVPALLRMLGMQEVAKNRVMGPSALPAMVLTFANDGPCLGVFCAMIISLLSQQNPHPCAWELEMIPESITPTCLYRNCVKFTIPKSHSNERTLKYPGTVVLIDAFTHFEVHLDLPECASNTLAAKLCSLIRCAVFEAIHQANLALHYIFPQPSVGALCPCGVGESHAAEIDMEENLMLCSKDTRKCNKLLLHQLIWSETQCMPPTCDSIPDPRQLQCIEKNGLTLRLIESVAPDWEELAIALEFEQHIIRTIKKDNRETEAACRAMLFQWLERKGHQPNTWRTLITALKDIQLASIADTLEQIL